MLNTLDYDEKKSYALTNERRWCACMNKVAAQAALNSTPSRREG